MAVDAPLAWHPPPRHNARGHSGAAGRAMDDTAADERVWQAQLVERVLRGDAQAFHELTVRYYRPVSGFVLRKVQRPDLVEDLVQETFLEAFRSLKAGKRPDHFAGW